MLQDNQDALEREVAALRTELAERDARREALLREIVERLEGPVTPPEFDDV